MEPVGASVPSTDRESEFPIPYIHDLKVPRVMKKPEKQNFPVHDARQYLEPGPIVLVSSKWEGKTNIMTMGWHNILEFSPSLFGCMITSGNHSHQMIRNSKECVINLPTTDLTDIVCRIGNCSGTDTDKFSEFGLTAEDATEVDAPLIAECHASFECHLYDDVLVDKYNYFIFEIVKAHVAKSPKHPETLHYTGNGIFMVAGKVIDRRKLFTKVL
jgi:flavin reductase (DIM6/NTAB) family NADH-FMN oxidoreductase RutF